MVGATFLLAACGGVLGTPFNEKSADKLAPIACAISNASAEDANYTAAISGDARVTRQDDFRVRANRERIFAARESELEAATGALSGVSFTDALGKQLVEAARLDLTDLKKLMAFNRREPPGSSALPPEATPGRLQQLIDDQSRPEVRARLSVCAVPPDLARRTKAYNG